MASLREVFDLVREQGGHGDPVGLLRDAGHTDLPEPLLALAIVNFADTLPAAAAEHLAGFVVPHSGVPLDGADLADPSVTGGLDLLATSPGGLEGEPAGLDGVAAEPPTGSLDRSPAEPLDEALGEALGEPLGEPLADPLGEAPVAENPLDAGFGGGTDGLDFGTGDRGPGDAPGPVARPEPAGDPGSPVPVELGGTDPGAVEPDAGVPADRAPADPARPEDADGTEDAEGPDDAGAGA